MDEESMDELRHKIIDGVNGYLEDYDWDNAFNKFFGEVQ